MRVMNWKSVFDLRSTWLHQARDSRFLRSLRPTRSKRMQIALGYAVSVLSVGVATLLRLGLDPVLGDHHPFTLYFAAVAVASWYGGFGPGFAAIVLSYFGADWFFIAPRFEFNLPRTDLDEFMALMAFLFSGFAIAFTAKLMRQALDRSRRKQRELEIEVRERQRAEQALKKAQAQLREHAARLEKSVQERTAHLQDTIRSLEGVCYHLAHDLRAPLRAMEGYTGILAKDLAPALDQNTMRYLENIGEAAQRMDRLIAGLLEYGRLGHAEFPTRRVPAGVVLDNVLHELTRRISAAKARIHLPSGYPDLMANDKLLELVFIQLFDNALTFVPQGVLPEINVRFDQVTAHEHAEDSIRCWVEDNGIGIPPDRREKAFWIFERLHPGNTYPGIGMGLALASKAIERMHGKIGVESGEIRGCRFWFELPAVHTEPRRKTSDHDKFAAEDEATKVADSVLAKS